jgi:hypothetical protein
MGAGGMRFFSSGGGKGASDARSFGDIRSIISRFFSSLAAQHRSVVNGPRLVQAAAVSFLVLPLSSHSGTSDRKRQETEKFAANHTSLGTKKGGYSVNNDCLLVV